MGTERSYSIDQRDLVAITKRDPAHHGLQMISVPSDISSCTEGLLM